MKELTVGKNDAGQRVDRYLAKTLPLLPASLCQKYLRLKRIKLNGKRAERDARLQEGDVLTLYINDAFFETPRPENAYLAVGTPRLNVVYEDDQILLVDKKPGQAVHPHDGATSSPICLPRASGIRRPSAALPLHCATVLTGIRAAS